MHETATSSSLKTFVSRFVDTFNTFDVSAILKHYAADALMNLGGEQVLRGHDEIRQALINFTTPHVPMTTNLRFVVATGETGMVSFDWKISGTGVDGTPVNISGTTTDVVRREADGQWRLLLDHPFGSMTAIGLAPSSSIIAEPSRRESIAEKGLENQQQHPNER